MTSRSLIRLVALASVLIFTGCGATEDGTTRAPASSTPGSETRDSSGNGEAVDRAPTKLDGTESQEFEQDDLDRAAEASDAVKEYCAGAVSEAQRLGCESHVTDADIP
jgi:hypothetical protein